MLNITRFIPGHSLTDIKFPDISRFSTHVVTWKISNTCCSNPTLITATADTQPVLFRGSQNSRYKKTKLSHTCQIVNKIKQLGQRTLENDYMCFTVLSLFFLLGTFYAQYSYSNGHILPNFMFHFMRIHYPLNF